MYMKSVPTDLLARWALPVLAQKYCNATTFLHPWNSSTIVYSLCEAILPYPSLCSMSDVAQKTMIVNYKDTAEGLQIKN